MASRIPLSSLGFVILVINNLLFSNFFIFSHNPLVLVVESATPSINSDKDALIAFRSQLSLDDPSNNNNPLSSWDHSSSPCNWSRVECNRFGQRVIGLNLSSLGLIGSISPDIGNLSFLRSLQLQNNQLIGGIPNEIVNLFRLRVLNMSFNSLEGPIPSNLTNLRELMVIDLMRNQLSGRVPEELGFLNNLRVLNLGRNLLSGPIPASLGNLSSTMMTSLNLGTNMLSGPIPSELSHLRNLKLLDLSINNLTGMVPTSIYNMSSLVYLVLASNQLWGELPYDVGERLPNLLAFNFCINNFTGRIPGSLHNLTNIQLIRMAHNRLHGSIPPGLGKLRSLTMYNIGYNMIVSSGDNWLDFITSLSNNTQLNFLAFDGNLIEGVIPESIGNLSKVLSKLYMGGNRLHGRIPSSIGQLTSLGLLNMSYNELTGPIPTQISQLKGLLVLDLAKNHIVGGIPESMGNLSMLSQLDLSANHLMGKVPSTLGGINSLLYMDLSSNMLNGSIPKEILSHSPYSNNLNLSNNLFNGQLPEEVGLLGLATVIDLSSNRLSGNIPGSISNCKSLEVLNLARNSFSGLIPSSMGGLKALESLDLSNNKLYGSIPSDLQRLDAIQSLNLSFNDLQGVIPCGGPFRNLTRVLLQGNPKLIVPNDLHIACQITRGHHTRGVDKAIIIIVVVVTLVLLIIVTSFLYVSRKMKVIPSSSTTSYSRTELHRIKYDELRRGTRDFSEGNLIGRGSFGSVYKGQVNIDNNVVSVAIKVLNMKVAASWKSFLAECEALRNVRHRNLVKLITSCSSLDHKNSKFLALIYEFLSNGSLEDWIRGKRKKENGDGLSFVERLDVAIDVASALDYVHHDSEVPVVHCDLKPSNILLNEDMTAKIGDFGLAKLLMENMGDQQQSISSSHVLKGSIGYMPPEYGLGVRPSTAGDTYSFGVTLLELFTGKSPTNESFTEDQDLVAWVRASFHTQVMQALLDPELMNNMQQHEYDHNGGRSIKLIKPTISTPEKLLDCSVAIFEVGLSCTVANPDERVTMRDALHKLKAARNKLL